MSLKFSFDIFTNFKMAGTLNSIAVLNHEVKWKSSNFPGLAHILLQVFFSFSDFQKLERDVAEYITNFRISQTKSCSQTSHKVRNDQKTNQFDGFRKVFGRFTNLDLATLRVLPMLGCWTLIHSLDSLSSFWISVKLNKTRDRKCGRPGTLELFHFIL